MALPALEIKISSPPNFFVKCSKDSFTAFSSVTSMTWDTMPVLNCLRSFFTSTVKASLSRSTRKRLAPFFANNSAVASPIPDAAPVM